MSKEAFGWLVIRFCGLLLLIETSLEFCGLLVKLGAIYDVFAAAATVGGTPTAQAYQLWMAIGIVAIRILVTGLLAVYLLVKGTAVHRLLMREGASTAARDAQERTSSPGVHLLR